MAGMKEGTGSDPFAEPADDDDDTPPETAATTGETVTTESQESTPTQTDPPSSTTDETSRPEPYIHTRAKVKEGREDYPVPLREDTREGIEDLKHEIESRFDDDVYKADLLEAAIEHAIEHPDDVAEMLETERYGYNWW